MSDSVKSALEKRKEQQQAEQQARVETYKKEQESVTAALKARDQRIASSIDSVASSINSRFQSVVKSYNDSISVKPSFGVKVSDVYKKQRKARMEVSDLLKEVEAYRKYFGDEATDSVVSTLKEIQRGHDSVLEQAEIMSQWDSEDAYNTWRKGEDQYNKEKSQAMEAADFLDHSQYVSNVKYGIGGKPSFTDDVYAYINNPTVEDKRWGGGKTTARDLIKASDSLYKWDTPLRGSESSEEKNALDYLDEDEIAIYNYYYAKEGKERADAFLSLIQERLNQRKANVIVKDIKSIDNDLLRTLETGAFGLNAGVDSWASGTKQFFTDEQLPTTAIQYANAEIYNSLDGLGKYAYSATNVIGNMAPSILVSSMAGMLGVPAKLAQGAGALTMGVSAAGGAYADALEKGYDKGRARVYRSKSVV